MHSQFQKSSSQGVTQPQKKNWSVQTCPVGQSPPQVGLCEVKQLGGWITALNGMTSYPSERTEALAVAFWLVRRALTTEEKEMGTSVAPVTKV